MLYRARTAARDSLFLSKVILSFYVYLNFQGWSILHLKKMQPSEDFGKLVKVTPRGLKRKELG